MAEVLSPVLTSNARVPLHTRPASSDQYLPSMSGSQSHSHYPQASRGPYNRHTGAQGYRGTAAAPSNPYSFRSSPLARKDAFGRATSAPSPPTAQPGPADPPVDGNRQQSAGIPNASSALPPASPPTSQPAASPTSLAAANPDSQLFANFNIPELTLPGSTKPADELDDVSDSAPDFAHPAPRRTDSSTSSQGTPKQSAFDRATASGVFGSGALGHFQYNPQRFGVNTSPPLRPVTTQALVAERPSSQSANNKETASAAKNQPDAATDVVSTSGSSAFSDTNKSSSLSPSAASLQTLADSETQRSVLSDSRPSSAKSWSNSTATRVESSPRSIASPDAVRRINNPSPLSRPMSGGSGSSGTVPHISSPYSVNPVITHSPAVAAMAALKSNEKEPKKGSKSRFRRAFSFGSAAELKRSAESGDAVDRARQRQEQFSSELDEEQDAIARQQEAAGLGNSIYTGQGGVFSGSTDNLSIASTASSASMMLRKMGQGMKKGGRSIRGLFRPKSVTGVPAADGPSEASVGAVTRVTVEAEREQINVNAHAHEKADGGTGFPKLERNSIDAAVEQASNLVTVGEGAGSKDSRRTIVGVDSDRQEVLAAVKRGILKRTAMASSPSGQPAMQQTDASPGLAVNVGAGVLPRVGSPVSSVTHSEPGKTGHRRTNSHALEGDDYFAGAAARLRGGRPSRSLPGTPRGMPRNISFSPRLQFYDVWSSAEYDRRGEIATANRLTPLLAQQIKEELNTFKMEMEVHEMSKPHTHFF